MRKYTRRDLCFDRTEVKKMHLFWKILRDCEGSSAQLTKKTDPPKKAVFRDIAQVSKKAIRSAKTLERSLL